jgi:hypothetical protein
MTNRILAAALLVALTTTTTLAASTLPQTPAGGPTITIGGDITSPGDPFRPGDVRGGTDRGHGPTSDGALPKSTKDIICRVGEGRNGVSYVSLVNDTGAIIPAGATITVYIQPGNIEKQVQIETDWPPGKKLDVILKGMSVEKDAACAVQLQLETGEPPADNFMAGLTVDLEDFDNTLTIPVAACLVYPADNMVMLSNVGMVDWPDGTKITVALPNGQVLEKSFPNGFHPSAGTAIPWELLFYPDAVPTLGEYLPSDWTCSIEITLPDAAN